jgi:hypothetical protein
MYLNLLEGDLGKLFSAKGLNYQRAKTSKVVIPTKQNKSALIGIKDNLRNSSVSDPKYGGDSDRAMS